MVCYTVVWYGMLCCAVLWYGRIGYCMLGYSVMSYGIILCGMMYVMMHCMWYHQGVVGMYFVTV